MEKSLNALLEAVAKFQAEIEKGRAALVTLDNQKREAEAALAEAKAEHAETTRQHDQVQSSLSALREKFGVAQKVA